MSALEVVRGDVAETADEPLGAVLGDRLHGWVHEQLDQADDLLVQFDRGEDTALAGRVAGVGHSFDGRPRRNELRCGRLEHEAEEGFVRLRALAVVDQAGLTEFDLVLKP